MNHLKYLLYVLRHKFYVFIECCRLGIVWRGITHDLSKFSRAEWTPYVNEFYGNGDSPDFDLACFNAAWEHHYRINTHHWNHWICVCSVNCGDIDWHKDVLYIMGEDDVKEMVADWCAMARTMGGSAAEYYEKNKKNMKIHQYTRQYLAGLLLEFGQNYYRKESK